MRIHVNISSSSSGCSCKIVFFNFKKVVFSKLIHETLELYGAKRMTGERERAQRRIVCPAKEASVDVFVNGNDYTQSVLSSLM